MIKIKNETNCIIELNGYEDANGQAIFGCGEVLNFNNWKEINFREVIVYDEDNRQQFISNGYTDYEGNEYCEIYLA